MIDEKQGDRNRQNRLTDYVSAFEPGAAPATRRILTIDGGGIIVPAQSPQRIHMMVNSVFT